MTIKIAGQEYDFVFNGAAMLAIQEKYQTDNVSELIEAKDAVALQRTCKIAVILAEQGELLRRYMGHDSREMLTESTLLSILSPVGIIQLKTAVLNAMFAGYARSVESGDEIDVVLAELNKKK